MPFISISRSRVKYLRNWISCLEDLNLTILCNPNSNSRLSGRKLASCSTHFLGLQEKSLLRFVVWIRSIDTQKVEKKSWEGSSVPASDWFHSQFSLQKRKERTLKWKVRKRGCNSRMKLEIRFRYFHLLLYNLSFDPRLLLRFLTWNSLALKVQKRLYNWRNVNVSSPKQVNFETQEEGNIERVKRLYYWRGNSAWKELDRQRDMKGQEKETVLKRRCYSLMQHKNRVEEIHFVPFTLRV